MDAAFYLRTSQQMSKTSLQQQITIHALPSKVWRVLTNPDYTNQYLSDGDLHSDWTEGSSIYLIIENETKTESINVGKVLESVPGILLKLRLREENASTYLITTYELTVAHEGIELKMKCEGFTATQPEWLIRVQQANLLLQKIKWLSEYS